MSFCEDTTWQKDHSDPKDPVHKHEDGTWWFFDETWAYEHGPFDSEAQANEYLNKYVEAFCLSNSQIMTRMEKG